MTTVMMGFMGICNRHRRQDYTHTHLICRVLDAVSTEELAKVFTVWLDAGLGLAKLERVVIIR
jgi:hypothetical protein